MTILPVTKQLSQVQVQRYADATGDHNPIHVNEVFADKTPFGGTIAHGMLVLASISEMMAASLGEAWLRHGKLHVRFKAPTRTNDTITASAQRNASGAYAVEVRNQADEVLISGTTELAAGG